MICCLCNFLMFRQLIDIIEFQFTERVIKIYHSTSNINFMKLWFTLRVKMSSVVYSSVSKWGRLYADVSIWGGSRVETSSSRSQYMRFRPLIDNIECGLVGMTCWMPQLTDLELSQCILLMRASVFLKCITDFPQNLTVRSHEKSATSRLGKCWREEHNTV